MKTSHEESFLSKPHGITEQARRLRARGSVLHTAPILTQALLTHALRAWSQGLSQLVIFRTAAAVKAYHELELYWGLHCLAQELSSEEQEVAFSRFKKHYDFITEEALKASHRQAHSGEHKKELRRLIHSLTYYGTALLQAVSAESTRLFSWRSLAFTQALKYQETAAAFPDFMSKPLGSLESFHELAARELESLEVLVSLREQDEASLERLRDFHASYRLARGAGLRPVTRPVHDPAIYSKMRFFTVINQATLEPDQVASGLHDYERHVVVPTARIPWADDFVEEFRKLYSPFAPQYMRLYELAAKLTTQLTQQRPTEFRTLTAHKLQALLDQVLGHEDELSIYGECLQVMKIYRTRTTSSVLEEATLEEFEVRLEASLLLN